jgi:hypothetical protein
MLDYVLMQGFECSNMSIQYGYDFASDHCCIEFCVQLPDKPRKFSYHRPQRLHIQWDAPEVKRRLQHGCCDFAPEDNLQTLQDKLVNETRFLSTYCPRRHKKAVPVELANMFHALEVSECPVEQKSLGKQIYRYKRSLAASARSSALGANIDKKLVLKPKSKKSGCSSLICDGLPSEDRALWSHEISSFYAGLYSDDSVVKLPGGGSCVDPARRGELLAKQRARLCELRNKSSGTPRIAVPLWLVLEARARFASRASSACGVDGVSWHLLLSLSISDVELLRRCFEDRLNLGKNNSGVIRGWDVVGVTLIEKKVQANRIQDFRPISLCSCLQKWFMKVLVELLGALAPPLSPAAVGFARGHQTAEVTETIRQCLEKGRLWGRPTCILQCDAHKAFDSINHDILRNVLLQSGCPPKLVYCIFQELHHSRMCLTLGDVPGAHEVLLDKAGRQGASETPELWNRYFDSAVSRAREIFREKGLGLLFQGDGIEHSDFSVDILYWADDVYIFGQSESMCREMFIVLSAELAKLNLRWKEGSVSFIDNCASNDCVVHESWETPVGTYEVANTPAMTALGVLFDRDGSTMASVKHRLKCFWASWSLCRNLLCDRRVPLRSRILKFYSALGKTLLYGSGGWTLNPAVLREIQNAEAICLFAMSCRKPHPWESKEDFNMRIRGFIEATLAKCGSMTLAMQCCYSYFGWAGHVMRLPEHSFVRRLVLWKNILWLRVHQDLQAVRWDRMASRGRPSRWENALESGIHACWGSLAYDRAAWRRMSKFAGGILWGRMLVRAPGLLWIRSALPSCSSRRDAIIPRVEVGGFRLAICGDNMQAIEQTQGTWGREKGAHADVKNEIRWLLHSVQQSLGVVPWPGGERLLFHRKRRYNYHSDAVANRALDLNRVVASHQRIEVTSKSNFMLCFDGAARENGLHCSMGACLWIFEEDRPPVCAALLGVPLGEGTNVQAEFVGCLFALYMLCDWLKLYCSRKPDGSQLVFLGREVPAV